MDFIAEHTFLIHMHIHHSTNAVYVNHQICIEIIQEKILLSTELLNHNYLHFGILFTIEINPSVCSYFLLKFTVHALFITRSTLASIRTSQLG